MGALFDRILLRSSLIELPEIAIDTDIQDQALINYLSRFERFVNFFRLRANNIIRMSQRIGRSFGQSHVRLLQSSHDRLVHGRRVHAGCRCRISGSPGLARKREACGNGNGRCIGNNKRIGVVRWSVRGHERSEHRSRNRNFPAPDGYCCEPPIYDQCTRPGKIRLHLRPTRISSKGPQASSSAARRRIVGVHPCRLERKIFEANDR